MYYILIILTVITVIIFVAAITNGESNTNKNDEYSIIEKIKKSVDQEEDSVVVQCSESQADSKVNLNKSDSHHMSDVAWLLEMNDYLVKRDRKYPDTFDSRVKARKRGRRFSISEHVRGMIYALLTNQRKWSTVVPHLEEIDKVFYNYDVKEILTTSGTYFERKIKEIKCGNIRTKYQMQDLSYNISVFKNIERKYGTLDDFVESKPAYKIVEILSNPNSEFKLKNMGEALCWEYLRNVGVDGAKPDVHLKRFLGSNRMKLGSRETLSEKEVYTIVSTLSRKSGLTMAAIDNIIWSFCATDYGEICGANPKCRICPISKYCSKGQL